MRQGSNDCFLMCVVSCESGGGVPAGSRDVAMRQRYINTFSKKNFLQKIYKLSTHVVFLAYEFSRNTSCGSN